MTYARGTRPCAKPMLGARKRVMRTSLGRILGQERINVAKDKHTSSHLLTDRDAASVVSDGIFPASVSLPLFDDRFDLSLADRTFERAVVLLVLIGIRDRESGDSFVESVTLAQVPADHCWVSGARMGERQRVAAALGKEDHPDRLERLDGKLNLDVPQLADIKVPSQPALGQAEEDVAGRLHEPVAVYDTLTVVREDAHPRIVLQDRGDRQR